MTPANQQAAPLLDCLQTLANRQRAAFHTPGHKQGQSAPAPLTNLLGTQVFRADLPELPELDNLFAPTGVIQAAQALAAAAFGAEQTWFLANGSTCGIAAAVLATCCPGERLIVPRNAHQSLISALILSGAIPIWVEPDYDPDWQIALCPSPASIQAALAEHPDAKAVLLVSPTYHGICADIASIAQITQQYDIPLLVDEAHGAHLAFHPDLPPSALASGADLAVQSIHKTLSALTQAAMLHVQGNRLDRNRISQALQLVQSTSPSYLLLASLDAARQQMATTGEALLDQTLHLAAQARTQLSQIPGLAVLTTSSQSATNRYQLDPTRLTIDVTGLGLTGFQADEILHQSLNVTAELPGLNTLTFILTPGNTPADIAHLIQACQSLAATPHSPPPTARLIFLAPWGQCARVEAPHPPPPTISPRAAFFSPTLVLPTEQAIHQISAELICPYPPGIPVLLPGELITAEAVAYLRQILASGGILSGCADPTLDTLRVIRQTSNDETGKQ
ncbi:MAG: aminotransferase class I/II-fold pyridoxal phosphate-dependent enzyme [Elainella sp. C42_A2020_010]|nr:aminotransferase class I/II-fold pyridoxal phosphate-dependent enzyme [Elainella sp. C42_A2020_010]